MSPEVDTRTIEIVLVAAGVLLTLAIGGALLMWIVRGWNPDDGEPPVTARKAPSETDSFVNRRDVADGFAPSDGD